MTEVARGEGQPTRRFDHTRFGGERNVGITTTIPVEAVFAAGLRPVDLNNVFVSHPERQRMLDVALEEGFPQNACAWTKGIFGVVAAPGGPGLVVGVVRGDCSGTEVLLEALSARGVRVFPFSYPYPPSREDLEREIGRLCSYLGTSMDEAGRWCQRLSKVRAGLAGLDRMCWLENRVTGFENHLWLVSSSDFGGDPDRFTRELDAFVLEAAGREPLDRRAGIPFAREVRLGYLGVPPINTDIFPLAEAAGARFVFFEVQRQFSMPPAGRPEDIVDQYLRYTYPYSVAGRAADINRETSRRGLDGLVHYVQSFCHRNLEDVLFSKTLNAPVLTIECDCPGELGAGARSRLENFIQVLGENL